MSINQMRDAIAVAYQGYKWKNKVARMSDAQVIAIYHKFIESKKIS